MPTLRPIALLRDRLREATSGVGAIRRAGLSRLVGAAALGLGLSGAPTLAQDITVWSGYPEMEPFYKRVAEGLKPKFPNLKVSVQAIPLREHEKRLALSLPSRSAADVLEMEVATAQRYLEAGLLQPAPAPASALVNDAASFDPFFRDTATSEGKVVAVPLFRGQGALYYNTEMFAAAGLSAPPRTMAEYTDYAKKLTQRDASGKPTVSGWSLRLSGGGQGIAEKFWINLFQHGGNLLTQKGNKWSATYADEAGRATLKQYLQSIYVDRVVSPEMPADADAFERKQTAMFIRESWVVGDIAKKAPDLPYATAPLPRGSIVATVNLWVPSTGPKGDAAWAFAVAANEPDNLVWLLDNVGWLPNRKNVDLGAVIKAKPAFNAFVNTPQGYGFFRLPAIGPVDEVLTRLAARLVSAYGNPDLVKSDAAIDAFLKAAAAETDGILQREGLLGK
jgi:multiple sugar transport system substrate-binding protein